MQRDSLASFVGHSPMVLYMALAENEAVARVRYDLLEVRAIGFCRLLNFFFFFFFSLQRMIAPCGVPPPVEGKKAKLEEDI